MDLPDFLLLPEADIAREKRRQENLRRDFNSRARLSPAEVEAARSFVIEEDLRRTLKTQRGRELRRQTRNQLADVISAQGRFTEAAQLTSDKQAKEFFKKAADAIFHRKECTDTGKIETIAGATIRLPKYRVIKQVYSMKLGQYGYLAECNTCGNWVFLGSNPLPDSINPAEFDPATTPNDLQRLKV
jgi:hypothetical protein